MISENTIEENILKRANQKRRLGEITIDEAEFTPNFFQNLDNIRDLFSNEKVVADIVAPIHIASCNIKEIEEVNFLENNFVLILVYGKS